jgi:hypothetical protein
VKVQISLRLRCWVIQVAKILRRRGREPAVIAQVQPPATIPLIRCAEKFTGEPQGRSPLGFELARSSEQLAALEWAAQWVILALAFSPPSAELKELIAPLRRLLELAPSAPSEGVVRELLNPHPPIQ